MIYNYPVNLTHIYPKLSALFYATPSITSKLIPFEGLNFRNNGISGELGSFKNISPSMPLDVLILAFRIDFGLRFGLRSSQHLA